MKIAALILPFFLLSSALYAGNTGNSFHVLCYHAFIPSKNRYCFSLDELESHIKGLEKKGFRFVSLSDIRAGRFSGVKNVLVSLDDGNRSAWDAYYRVLKKHSIRPVLAIYPSVIGRRKYALTWKQLAALSRDGCDIAAHGYSHRCLKDRLYRSDSKTFKREIFLSKKVLEKRLNKKIDVFVYPYGATSGPALRLVREAGYACAFTVQKGGMPAHGRGVEDCLEIPRYCMTRDNSRKYLNLIAGNFLYHGSGDEYRVARVKSPPVEKKSTDVPLHVFTAPPVEKKRAREPVRFFAAGSRFIINRVNTLKIIPERKPLPGSDRGPGAGHTGFPGLLHPSDALAYGSPSKTPPESVPVRIHSGGHTVKVKTGCLSAADRCSSAYRTLLDRAGKRVGKAGRALDAFFTRDPGSGR